MSTGTIESFECLDSQEKKGLSIQFCSGAFCFMKQLTLKIQFFFPYLALLSILLSTANLLLKRFFVTSFLKDLLKSKNRKINLAVISYFCSIGTCMFSGEVHWHIKMDSKSSALCLTLWICMHLYILWWIWFCDNYWTFRVLH